MSGPTSFVHRRWRRLAGWFEVRARERRAHLRETRARRAAALEAAAPKQVESAAATVLPVENTPVADAPPWDTDASSEALVEDVEPEPAEDEIPIHALEEYMPVAPGGADAVP